MSLIPSAPLISRSYKRLLSAVSVSLLLGVVYLISELLLTTTRRSRSRTGTKQDRSTLRVVWLVIIASVAAGIYVAKYWPAAALPYHRSFLFAGVVLFVAGPLHLLNGEKNLIRKAENKRHRSPTNQLA